jgi:hypothetical protein
LVLLVALLVLGLLWRLSQGPLEIGFLDQIIEAAAHDLPSGHAVEFSSVALFWDRPAQRLFLEVRGLVLTDSNQVEIGHLRAVKTGVSELPLFRGQVQVTSLELNDAGLHLSRLADGSLSVKEHRDAADPTSASAGSGDMMPVIRHLVDRMNSTPDPSRPMSYLQKFSVQGSLYADDKVLGNESIVAAVQVDFRRGESGVTADGDLQVAKPEPLAGLAATLAVRTSRRESRLRCAFSGLNPAVIAAIRPDLSDIRGIDLALNGSLSAALPADGLPEEIEFKLVGGTGTVSHATWLPDPVPVNQLKVQGNLDWQPRAVRIGEASLLLGSPGTEGPSLEMKGDFDRHGGRPGLRVQGTGSRLTVEDIHAMWPPGIATGTRSWILKNIVEGRSEEVTLDLALKLPTEAEPSVELARLHGTFQFSDLGIYPYRPMEPIRAISGKGRCDMNGVSLSIASGALRDLAIRTAVVTVTGFTNHAARLAVEGDVGGKLSTAVGLLLHPPLELIPNVRDLESRVEGEAEIHLKLDLPLSKSAGDEGLDLSVAATLREASVRDVFRGQGIENGDLRLIYGDRLLRADGIMEFGPIPISLSGSVDVGPTHGPVIKAKLGAAEMPAAAFTNFGLRAGMFEGLISLESEIDLAVRGSGTIRTRADLNNSSVQLPLGLWTKSAGDPATATATLELNAFRPEALRDIDVQGPGLTVKGDVQFNRQRSSVEQVSLQTLTLGGTHLEGVLASYDDERVLNLHIPGGVLDLQPVLRSLMGPGSPAAEQAGKDAETREHPEERPASVLPVNIRVDRLETLILSDEWPLQQVNIQLRSDREGWQHIHFDADVSEVTSGSLRLRPRARGAQTSGVNRVTVDFAPVPDGDYALQVSADNFGDTLEALGEATASASTRRLR